MFNISKYINLEKIKKIELGKLILFLIFRPKTIYTILFFLIGHLIGSLGIYLGQAQFIDLINEVGQLFELNPSTIEVLIKLSQFVFGISSTVVIIEFFFIAIFIVILIYKIKKDPRSEIDSRRIKSIEDISSETKKSVDEAITGLATIGKQIENKDSKTKIDVIYVKNGLMTIIEYCVDLSRNGKPNQALGILSQHRNLLNVLDKSLLVGLEFDVAEAKALREASKITDAIVKNKEIISQYKDEIRPYLYLADMYLQISDFGKYREYFNEAKKIDCDHPVLKTLIILEKFRKEEKIELDDSDIWGDRDSFDRSNCYYIHSIINHVNGNNEERDRFIKEAIKVDKKYIYFKTKEIEYRIFDLGQKKKTNEVDVFNSDELKEIKQDIEKLEFIVKDDDAPKRPSEIEFLKLEVSFLQHPNNDYQMVKQNVTALVDLLIQTRFDDSNDYRIRDMLDGAQPFVTKELIDKLMDHITRGEKKPTDLLIFLLLITAIYCFEKIEDVIGLSKKFDKHSLDDLLIALQSRDDNLVIKAIDSFDQKKKFKIIVSIKDITLQLKLIDYFSNSLDKDKKDFLLKFKTGLLLESGDFEIAIKLIQDVDLSTADAVMSELAFNVARKLGIYHHIERDALKRLLELNAYPDRKYIFLSNLAISQYYLKELPDAFKNAEESLKNGKNLSIEGLQFLLFLSLDILISGGDFPNAEKLVNQYKHIQRDYKLSMKISEIKLFNKQFDEATEIVVNATLQIENITSEQMLASWYQLMLIQNTSGEEIIKPQKVDKGTFVKLSDIDELFFIGKEDKSLDAVSLQNKSDKRYKALISKKIGDEIDWSGDEGRMKKIMRKVENILFVVDYIGFKGTQCMQKMAQAGNPYIKMIEVGTTPESIKSSLIKFFDKEEKDFNLFIEGKLPFSFYTTLIGSIGNAFSKIRFSQKGFINTVLNTEDWEYQKNNAIEAINGKKVHIDGTSLLVIFESNVYKEVISYLSNFNVPGSAIDEQRSLIQRFSSVRKGGSMQIGIRNQEIMPIIYDEKSADKIMSYAKDFCDYIQNSAKSIYGVGTQERSDNVIEERILPSISDAIIKSQQEIDSLVMTEDPTYITLNNKFTGKRKPRYFSLLALVAVLLDQDKLNLDNYLNIFHLLSTNRQRFFPTYTDIIIKSIIRKNEGIFTIHPDSVDKFNLGLVWSDEYGINIGSVIKVCSDVFVALIKDLSIAEDYLKLIFPKLYIPVFENRNAHYWTEVLLQVIAIKIKRSSLVYSFKIEDRFELLQTMLNDYLMDKLVIR